MISSTQGDLFQILNWNKEENNTEVDTLIVNCVKQEGIEKNYNLKLCSAKCLRTEF